MRKDKIDLKKNNRLRPADGLSKQRKKPLPFPAPPAAPKRDEFVLWSEGDDRYMVTWVVTKVTRAGATVVPIKKP